MIIISFVFISLTTYLLVKKYNPHAVLLLAGIAMLGIGLFFGQNIPIGTSTGFKGFDIFALIRDILSDKGAKSGLMIMSIGGFVAYMNHIKAGEALVYISIKPLRIFQKFPYVAASLVILIGQFLSACIPSAVGLGLLLMPSIYPLLMRLGVSRLTAVSVIVACTAFDVGPASANTNYAAVDLLKMDTVFYFLKHQLGMVSMLTVVLMLVYYFTNKYFDKKQGKQNDTANLTVKEKPSVPLIYAILPVLPLILLITFSKFFVLFYPPISLDTTTSMIISMLVALVFEWIRTKKLKRTLDSLKIFWKGMGDIFASVVTLIIAAQVFSKGLITLNFVKGLIDGTQSVGLAFTGVSIVMVLLVFLISILMGSGNAAFFSFGELAPGIAKEFSGSVVSIVLPMQLAASMGRCVSPISGVVIATAAIADVTPFDLIKRNAIPLFAGIIVMIVYHFI